MISGIPFPKWEKNHEPTSVQPRRGPRRSPYTTAAQPLNKSKHPLTKPNLPHQNLIQNQIKIKFQNLQWQGDQMEREPKTKDNTSLPLTIDNTSSDESSGCPNQNPFYINPEDSSILSSQWWGAGGNFLISDIILISDFDGLRVI